MKKILIVDDKEESRYLLEVLLKGSGYEVRTASNGEEALEELKGGEFDLIISDILMPVMDGFELCRQMRRNKKLRNIPFIIYTATYTGPEDEEFALKIGADCFIQKPCEPDVLISVINEVISTSIQRELVYLKAEEKEAYKVYSERLIRKLEQKAKALEEEVQKRKEAEERAQAYAANWRKTFDAMPDPTAIIDIDGTIKQCNRAFVDFLGKDPQDLVGEKCFRMVHKTKDYIDNCPLLRSLKSSVQETLEMSIDQKTFLVIVDPIKNSEGNVIGFVHIMRDITELRGREKALKESEEKYRMVVENAGDAIAIVQGKFFKFVNKRMTEILGYSQEEILSSPFWEIVHPDDREKVIDSYSRRMRGEKVPQTYSFRAVDKEGNCKWAEINVVEILYQGKPAVLCFVRDITERKRSEEEIALLQEQFRQAQKMEAIGRLAGGVAHDFNNILTVIKGTCHLSLMDLRQGDQIYANIKEIEKAADRASDLTRQLLAFGRRQIMEMRIVDLNDLVKGLEKMLKRIIGEDIQLVTYLSDDLGRVRVDPAHMEQAIINLVVNARDAMPRGGKLTIETMNVELDEEYARRHIAINPGSYVMLAISDTGVGMTKEVQERIFEPFFTTKEMGRGTGLGLSTVYGIVKQSGGNIWVYSEPGQGAIFKIYLPRVDKPLEKRREEVIGEVPRGDETVLVIEDDEAVRKLAVRLLKKQGYNVLEAPDGGKAFTLCERYSDPIHLLLTDVVMPGMSGKELVERLKKIHPEAKVLYMSGYTDNVILHHGILEEGLSFIQKPFALESLARKVREVLNK